MPPLAPHHSLQNPVGNTDNNKQEGRGRECGSVEHGVGLVLCESGGFHGVTGLGWISGFTPSTTVIGAPASVLVEDQGGFRARPLHCVESVSGRVKPDLPPFGN